MSRKRRSVTPQSRLIRSVSVRHNPYHVSSVKEQVVETAEEVVSAVQEVRDAAIEETTVSAEPAVSSEPAVKESIFTSLSEKWNARKEAEHSDTVIQEEEEEPKLTWKERRAARKKAKDDFLEAVIDEPQVSWIRSLVDPIYAVDTMSRADYATVNFITAHVLMYLKWVAVFANVMVIVYGFINRNPYGFSRLNFSEASNYTFLYALYAFIAEWMTFRIAEVTCGTFKEPLNRSRLLSVGSYTEPCKIALFAISAFLCYKNAALGVGLFIASLVFSGCLKTYTIYKATNCSRRMFVTLFVCTVVFTFFGLKYVSFVSAGLLRIFENIMNI